MPDDKRTGQIGGQKSPVISASLSTATPAKWADTVEGQLSIPAWPQLPDIPFVIGGVTQTKRWVWAEWFDPPLGQGRTIIDFRWSEVLTLVKTTDANGKFTRIYLSFVVDPGVVVWNPFVQGTEPHIHALLVEPNLSFDFGTFSSGCGVSTYISRVIELNVDIFDITFQAGLTLDGFSFVFC